MKLNRRHKVGLFLVLVATGLSFFLEASAKQTAGIVLLGIAAAWFFGSLSLRLLGFVSCSLLCVAGLWIAVFPIWQGWASYRVSAQDYDSAIAAIRGAIPEAPVYTTDKKYGLEPATPNAAPASRAAKKPQKPEEHGPWEDYQPATKKPQKPTTSDDEWQYFSAKKNSGKPAEKISPPPPGFIPDNEVIFDRAVEIPEIARKWMRLTPEERDGGWVTVEESFPGDMSDQDIIRDFQTRLLQPRPTFSARAAIASHRIACFGGGLLSFLGLLGCAFLILQARKAKPKAVHT